MRHQYYILLMETIYLDKVCHDILKGDAQCNCYAFCGIRNRAIMEFGRAEKLPHMQYLKGLYLSKHTDGAENGNLERCRPHVQHTSSAGLQLLLLMVQCGWGFLQR
ncbi:hypothetical protein Ancab_020795 [Ancistrocladus abbreviatus]